MRISRASAVLVLAVFALAPATDNLPPIDVAHVDLQARMFRDRHYADVLLERRASEPRPSQVDRAGWIADGLSRKVVRRGEGDRKLAVLTFDDGPDPLTTLPLVTILAEHDVRATFYVTGRNVERYPELTRMIADYGHELGNHTFHHPNLTWLNREQIRAELQATNDTVFAITGREAISLRPPGGNVDAHVVEAAAELGLTTALWSVNSIDYSAIHPETVVERTTKAMEAGDVILLHESVEATVEALPSIIRSWRDAGYEFVTMRDLMASKREDDPL